MSYFLLVITVFLTSLQCVFQKQYNMKNAAPNVFLFSAVSAFSAMVFFAISAGFKLDFTAGLIPYSMAFSVSYSAAVIGFTMAIRFGSFAITSLVLSYSLIIPTMYGMVILKEPVGIMAYAGIALLLISLLLLNLKKEKAEFSAKWIIAVIIGFIGNGMCSTTQKMQQMRFGGEYKSEFMIAALFLAVVIQLIFASRCKSVKHEIRHCAKYAVPYGIFNGAANLLVMVLTGLVPNAILFPSVSAGGIILSCIAALVIYKEKLTKMQWAGYLLGTASVVLLNLN